MATDNKSDLQPLLVDSNKNKTEKKSINKIIIISFVILIILIGIYLLIAGLTEIWPFESDDDESTISPFDSIRFVISDFTPPGAILYQSYPLDICVNIGVVQIPPFNQQIYGIYSCNNNGDIVTFTNYADDELCSDLTNTTIGEEINYNSSINPGEYHSFNCFGQDNYVIGLQFDNDDTCCNSPTQSIAALATDICHQQAPGNPYPYAMCVTFPFFFLCGLANENMVPYVDMIYDK